MPSPIVAIPAYFVAIFLPHMYSISILGSVDRKLYDNSNPQAATTPDRLRKVLKPAQFAQWERARSAHRNGLESFPLFAATMLAGVMMDVPGMWAVAGANVALRIFYNGLYLYTTTQRNSHFRSIVWGLGIALNMITLVRAGLK